LVASVCLSLVAFNHVLIADCGQQAGAHLKLKSFVGNEKIVGYGFRASWSPDLIEPEPMRACISHALQSEF